MQQLYRECCAFYSETVNNKVEQLVLILCWRLFVPFTSSSVLVCERLVSFSLPHFPSLPSSFPFFLTFLPSSPSLPLSAGSLKKDRDSLMKRVKELQEEVGREIELLNREVVAASAIESAHNKLVKQTEVFLTELRQREQTQIEEEKEVRMGTCIP